MQVKDITLIDYSPKSIAIQGKETKKYKELFKGSPFNGKYNPYLKGGAGWIFSKKHKDLLIKRINEFNPKTNE